MDRFYDVTVEGQPRRLELHSTSVVHDNGRPRIDIHFDTSALTDVLPADAALPLGAAAQAALAAVPIACLYPDQSYEEIMRRRELA